MKSLTDGYQHDLLMKQRNVLQGVGVESELLRGFRLSRVSRTPLGMASLLRPRNLGHRDAMTNCLQTCFSMVK